MHPACCYNTSGRWLHQAREEQRKDPVLRQAARHVDKTPWKSVTPHFTVAGSVLFTEDRKLAIPDHLVDEAILRAHELMGHKGPAATQHCLQQRRRSPT